MASCSCDRKLSIKCSTFSDGLHKQEHPPSFLTHASMHLHTHTDAPTAFFSVTHTNLYHDPVSISSVISICACSWVSVSASACFIGMWECMWWSLEAVLTQLSDYSGILRHWKIRPIGKTTGEKQRKYHSVALMKQHREESWLSDLTLRGFKTNPGKVRETKLEKIEICSCGMSLYKLHVSISVYLLQSCVSCTAIWQLICVAVHVLALVYH